MAQALPNVAQEQHGRLVAQVDRLPDVADRLLGGTPGDARHGLDETATFLAGTVLPHMELAERQVYPELERMYQNRHSMAPMRREHEEVRRLIGAFTDLAGASNGTTLGMRRVLALRRILFQLYALLRIHLAEEEIYLRIVARGPAPDLADLLAAATDQPAS